MSAHVSEGTSIELGAHVRMYEQTAARFKYVFCGLSDCGGGRGRLSEAGQRLLHKKPHHLSPDVRLFQVCIVVRNR